MNKIRIAICLSGEPRYWERAAKTIHNFIYDDEQNICQVDIFYHFWDNITKRQSELISDPVIEIVDENKLKKYFTPTVGVCESKDKLNEHIKVAWDYIQKIKQENDAQEEPTNTNEELFSELVKTTNKPPFSQLISMCKSIQLMTDYAEQNNIYYDIVIRTRSDIEILKTSIVKIQSLVTKNKLSRYIRFPAMSIRSSRNITYNPYVEYCFFMSSSNIINNVLIHNYTDRICKLLFAIKPKTNKKPKISYVSSHNVVPLLFKGNDKIELGAGLLCFQYKLYQIPSKISDYSKHKVDI